MLSLTGHKFAVNPKGGLEKFVDIVIKDDLSNIIKCI